MYYKLAELEVLLEDVQLDIICMTETWLTTDIISTEIVLNGFSLPISKDRSGRRGGGCILYAREGLNVK